MRVCVCVCFRPFNEKWVDGAGWNGELEREKENARPPDQEERGGDRGRERDAETEREHREGERLRARGMPTPSELGACKRSYRLEKGARGELTDGEPGGASQKIHVYLPTYVVVKGSQGKNSRRSRGCCVTHVRFLCQRGGCVCVCVLGRGDEWMGVELRKSG